MSMHLLLDLTGPCQFPTLGFVVDQYKKVEAFIPEDFWKIDMEYKDPVDPRVVANVCIDKHTNIAIRILCLLYNPYSIMKCAMYEPMYVEKHTIIAICRRHTHSICLSYKPILHYENVRYIDMLVLVEAWTFI